MFENVKPTDLIEYICKIATDKNDTILDFFSGSATTAHAIMNVNSEDGGKRKFIMVQLPEETGLKSDAFKEGFKNICEIGKERIRRSGMMIRKELEAKQSKQGIIPDDSIQDPKNMDFGFRVFSVDETSFKDVKVSPYELNQTSLFNFSDTIKEDRTSLDLLFQTILSLGMKLSSKIETKIIEGSEVYFVEGNSLVVCFENAIDYALIDAIAKVEPVKVVFKDSSFKTSSDRINVDERFKLYSPDTEIKIL